MPKKRRKAQPTHDPELAKALERLRQWLISIGVDPDAEVDPKQVRKWMIEDGIDPEECAFSRLIIAAREGREV